MAERLKVSAWNADVLLWSTESSNLSDPLNIAEDINMISICGDVHGFYELVVDYSRMAKEAGCVALCQVGDWGMHMREIHAAIVKSNYPHIPVYVIPGNHEYFDSWEGFEETKEVMHNVTFVQRGHIMKVDGLNVLFFGGASSIDKSYQGKNWDWREDIQPKDVERFEKNLLKFFLIPVMFGRTVG